MNQDPDTHFERAGQSQAPSVEQQNDLMSQIISVGGVFNRKQELMKGIKQKPDTYSDVDSNSTSDDEKEEEEPKGWEDPVK